MHALAVGGFVKFGQLQLRRERLARGEQFPLFGREDQRAERRALRVGKAEHQRDAAYIF